MGNYFVSIIIPTYNEEVDIRRTLEACANLQYSYKEIIVVDDSTDNTPDIVKEYESSGVRLIKRERNEGGRCGARNVGILEARGNIIIILNADVLLPSDFIDRILPYYDIGADYVLVDSEVVNGEYLFARFVQALYVYHYRNADIEWSEGFSCRKKCAVDAGLFPIIPIPLISGEDGFFGNTLRSKGCKKVIDRSIVVKHIAPPTLKGYWHARKEKRSPFPLYFLRGWPLWYIFLRYSIATMLSITRILTLVLPLLSSYKIACHSSRKFKDWIPFFYAYSIQEMAHTLGRWQGFLKICKWKLSGKK